MQGQTISGFKLSPQQEYLWSLQQQNTSGYITQFSILLEGALQPERLKAALQKSINQHQILRAAFRRLSGKKMPVMIVEDNAYLKWQDIDLSDWDENKRATEIEKLFHEDRCQCFDLEQGPLLRLYLLKLLPNKCILLVSLPALCADILTVRNLVREIHSLYSDSLRSEEVRHEEGMQYLQVSEWQIQLLADEEAETANEYWRQQELSILDRLKLPFENQPLQLSRFNSEFIECVEETIAPQVTEKVSTLAQSHNTSSQVVLLACWQILLWRLTGGQDFMIGWKSDRREYEELQDVLGLIATWLPIKSHLSSDLCFFEVIELVQRAINDAEEWQDYFVHQPIDNAGDFDFPVGFEFQQFPGKQSAGGVSFSLYHQYSCIEPFKIKLTCTQYDDFLGVEFYYDVNYFSIDAIQRLTRQFQILLASATENFDSAINQLEILSQRDRQQLLFEFNQTQIDYSLDDCIHQLFEKQVEKTPDSIAVVFEDHQLTYAELNARANQLARYLQQVGVKPEMLVGLYVERSLEMIVALLGILKAGGAYLPLDPALPKSGLVFRLQDAQASILLTQRRLANDLADCAARIVCLDSDWNVLTSLPREHVDSEAKQEDLVYAIYTSGSTGKPKGVAIEHRQLCNYLLSIENILNLPSGASFAHISTLAADLGNTVIFSALCGGGCLHVLSLQRASNASALAAYFQRYPIDCLKVVPSHLAALLVPSSPQAILPQQLLILGGEVVNWELIQQIQQHMPECRIVNHYGPTEATVGTLTYPIRKGQTSCNSETVPLGRPLANTQVYVLDDKLQPLPLGVKGELYIGGAGLARGYINRPKETAERFIVNPFLEQQSIELSPETQIYRTGDLVRYLPDGNIEFIGRVDHQVKVRGFRIELGEVEAVLSQHLGVRQAVVSVQEDDPTDKRLVAYIVSSQKQTTNVSDLRNYLREKLPEYMIPSAFVMLKALPLTSNGKVDRRALPAPDSLRPELEATYAPPRTEMEQTIAGIWQEMLHLEKVGIDDNFFDLGGHSLLIIQVHSRLQESFKGDLLITDLFEYPTIRSLTKYLSKEASEVSTFEASDQRAEGRIAARQSRIRTR